MSRGTWECHKGVTEPFADGAITLYGGSFQRPSARLVICNSPARLQSGQVTSRYPGEATLAGYGTSPVWAGPLSLAATDGIAVAFLSWGY